MPNRGDKVYFGFQDYWGLRNFCGNPNPFPKAHDILFAHRNPETSAVDFTLVCASSRTGEKILVRMTAATPENLTGVPFRGSLEAEEAFKALTENGN